MTWELVKLENLITFLTSGSRGWSSYHSNSGAIFLKIQNVKATKLHLETVQYVQPPLTKEAERTKVQAEDLLISITADLGRTAVVSKDVAEHGAHINQHLALIRLNQNLVLPHYVAFFLESPAGKKQFTALDKNGVKSGLNFESINSLQIPLPPLPEQQRIAALLEKVDHLRSLRRQSLKRLDDLVQATFLEMFGDPVTNPMGWDVKPFSEVGKLDRGKSKHRPRNAPELLGGKHPLVQTGDVSNSGRYIYTYSQTYSDLGLSQSKKWPIDTLCITIAANIAKTTILKFECCFPDSIVGFSPFDSVKIEYIQEWLSFLQKNLEENAPESAQKNINLDILKKLSVPIPHIQLQTHFSQMVQRVEKQRLESQVSLTQIDKLFNTLMHQAFSGELNWKEAEQAVAAGQLELPLGV